MSHVANATYLQAHFRKSSHSGGDDNCVELATDLPHCVAVRDSKDPSGPALLFTPAAHTAFIAAATTGEFDFGLL
ncbi:DUF397 domain-containing protein [Kitasatospora purpeofusca]|uniref:DUF397 domain-containing protein n=1 Tax=Kitasatospora purpeofusca TaxID=67352 RepID=UPI003870C6B4|nr:DUF397 domain-containing protein [Kitasatospora purpeofusca]